MQGRLARVLPVDSKELPLSYHCHGWHSRRHLDRGRRRLDRFNAIVVVERILYHSQSDWAFKPFSADNVRKESSCLHADPDLDLNLPVVHNGLQAATPYPLCIHFKGDSSSVLIADKYRA
ncbi:hypothetical protein B0H16DRAFT_1464270 [Mycena metata]|uniref:Uncharacterized protein n=1 Tax=Mycena metata TaxID=1033252 RepID=A0AAD7IH63_9AGAR|nr:hypothetical protein B0H16DRAFT_1464270 [Mycena metata]